MKKTTIIAALLCAASSALFAQTLNVTAPGYSGMKLFDSTTGFTITGMGADLSGDIFYLETDGSFSASTTLYKRTASSGYATATPLFSYGAFVFGSFVAVEGGKVYFGESSTNSIRSINLDGSSPALLATVVGNFDMAFSAAGAFVSANPDTTFTNPQNQVVKLDLGNGATDLILNATPDFSGPIEFDAAGALLYGAAKSSIGGIYSYSVAEVTSAIGGSAITLTPPANRVVNNGANQFLAFAGGTSVWQDDFTTLRLFDLATGTGATVASTPQFIGHLDAKDGALFANVTNFGTNTSAVFKVVPEPSTVLLLAFGSLVSLRRRR
jgi:hypothetical protein